MNVISAFETGERHRYKWCPACEELWVVSWMASIGVNSCPLCDGRLLAYVGRSPYDIVSTRGANTCLSCGSQ